MNNVKFDLSDIAIIPAVQSNIESRSECNVYNSDGMLPLMASPMDTVVSPRNLHRYIHNHIVPCIPRGVQMIEPTVFSKKYSFKSFGLHEIENSLRLYRAMDEFDNREPRAFYQYSNVLIDIANGHMSRLVPIIKDIKHFFPELKLMVGNVANPETFVILGNAGADYVRISIGTGAGCTTAANVGINYPLGSLITECRKLKQQLKLSTKIVADGGMKNYSDVIKALALGADYVMIGSIFNKAIESAGFNYLFGVKISQRLAELLWSYGFPVKKKYRGMSTKAVQRSWGKTKLVTAEGITKYQKVEYTLGQWVENFEDFLRSDMSYSNAKKLDDFIGVAQCVFITDAARKRFDK